MSDPLTVLVVGATGSVGRHVVAEALTAGHHVRALVRDRDRARDLLPGAELVVGEVTLPETLADAVADIDAVVFTLGSNGRQGKAGAQTVDYGGVRNVLLAIGEGSVRVALMTAIGVTNRESPYNQNTETHDWKRRSERLLRASGHEYTIVRPGWFDYNSPDQQRIVMLQGDKRQSGTPADGVIARRQIARVLVASLESDAADHKTFELVAERGPEQQVLESLFGALNPDGSGALDAVGDPNNMPLEQEPPQVRADLDAIA
jgi:uncharacterized protein YbjT (DUF2867 family)